jgi:hypothetical protein
VSGACDVKTERLFAGIVAVRIVAEMLLLKVCVEVREGDFLDSHAFGLGSFGARLGLMFSGAARRILGKEAWEEPDHAAAESRHAGAENAHIQFDVTP